jgi:biopolymer transport protein ExbB
MDRWLSSGRAGTGLALVLAAVVSAGADGSGVDLDALGRQAGRLARAGAVWYERTPPADRVTWGGLVAAAALGLGVLAERSFRLRRRRIIPGDFEARFLERLRDGELGRGKALDFCELNPSPASRVALAAVKRWGRPVADLERAVALAQRVEADRLRRNVGTLRRVAALTPLLGLLGTLVATSRALGALGPGSGPGWGPALAAALGPLTAGVTVATLALVAYDGLAGRVEQLVGGLDRVGAETIDAIAMALPLDPPARPAPASAATPAAAARTPHQVRIEVPVPRPAPRPVVEDDDFD